MSITESSMQTDPSQVPVDNELIYVGDPMCSWCWGIAPSLDEMAGRRPDLPLRIVVGGLRPGPSAEEMTDEMAQFLSHHWHQVTARSGQPFNHDVLSERGWLYDTEVPCRAVVTMRELAPELEWQLFKRLQRAFYAEGIKVSDVSVYPDLISEFDIDGDAFTRIFESERAKKATWQDFSLARSWGINGFPTVLLRTGDKAHVVASGFATADHLEMALTPLLGSIDMAGEACGPGQIC